MKRSEMLRNQERKGMRREAATKQEKPLIVFCILQLLHLLEASWHTF